MIARWILGLALSLAAGAPAFAQARIEPRGHVFPGGEWRLEDWNGDGASDFFLRSPEDGSLRVWLARPGKRSWFGLRPDIEVRPPENCSALFRLFPGSESGARQGAPWLVAMDPGGLLAWEPGGEWARIWNGETFFQAPGRGRLARQPWMEDGGVLPDLDGDGERDLILCGSDGRWRIAWGPLRPGVEAPSSELGPSRIARSVGVESAGLPPDTLYGYAGRSGWGTAFDNGRLFRSDGRGQRLTFDSTLLAYEPASEGGHAWTERAEWRRGEAPGLLDVWTRQSVWRQGPARSFREEPRPPEPYVPPTLAPASPEASYEDKLGEMVLELAERLPAGESDNVLYEDIDGDGILDAFYIFGSSDPIRPRTNIRAYLGRADGSVPDFRRPSSQLRTRAMLLWPKLVDADGDGDLDAPLFFPSAGYATPSEQLKAYLQLGVPGELRLYLWEAGEGYSEARSHGISLNLKHEVFGMRLPGLGDARFIGDHDGDGNLDLGFATAAGTYTVWRFDPRTGFGKEPLFEVQAPGRVGSVAARDIDGDGRDDLVLETWDGERRRLDAIRVYLMR